LLFYVFYPVHPVHPVHPWVFENISWLLIIFCVCTFFISIARLKLPAFSRSALATLFLAMIDVLPKYAKQGFQPGECSVWTFSPLRPARTHLLSVGGCSVEFSKNSANISRDLWNNRSVYHFFLKH
jgi:hypothetical protein